MKSRVEKKYYHDSRGQGLNLGSSGYWCSYYAEHDSMMLVMMHDDMMAAIHGYEVA